MWWTLPRAEGSTLHGSAPQSPSGRAQAAGGLCLRGSRLGRPLLGKTDPPALDSARPLLANALLEPGERRGVACPSAKVTFGHSPVAVTTSEEALGDSGRERRCSPWSQPFPGEQGEGGRSVLLESRPCSPSQGLACSREPPPGGPGFGQGQAPGQGQWPREQAAKADPCLPVLQTGPSRRHSEASPRLAPGDALALRGVRPPLVYIPRVPSPAERRLEKDAPLLPKGRRAFLHAARREAGRPVSPEEEMDDLFPELLQTWGSLWRMEPRGLPGHPRALGSAGSPPHWGLRHSGLSTGKGGAWHWPTTPRPRPPGQGLPKACWLLPDSGSVGHMSLLLSPSWPGVTSSVLRLGWLLGQLP